MRKPSIFSSDYEKKMKKRRRKIIVLILSGIVVCSGAWLWSGKRLQSIKKENNKKIDNIDDDKEKNKKIVNGDMKNKKIENKDDKKKDENKKREKGYELTLSNGEKVKLMYEEDGSDKKFKYIMPLESKVNYDISPNGKNILIYDDKVQQIICYDINGQKKNVTNEKYISTNGSVVIERENHLKNNTDYVWCKEPKFIDDINIAYVSQLPWIGRTTKYIWITNIEQNTHFYVASIEGEEIKFNKITDKGLETIIDGRNLYLNSNGVVTQ